MCSAGQICNDDHPGFLLCRPSGGIFYALAKFFPVVFGLSCPVPLAKFAVNFVQSKNSTLISLSFFTRQSAVWPNYRRVDISVACHAK